MHRWTPLALLLALALAGCSGDDGTAPHGTEGPTATDGPAADGPVEMAAPEWAVGDNWIHHWFIPDGTGGETDFRTQVIVTGGMGSAWHLSAGDLQSAVFHGAFFFPDLGMMGKSDWTVRSGDYAYPWYSFPLTDGKTWSAPESNLDFDLEPVQRTLHFRSTWVAAEGGNPGHYLVEAHDGNALRARYDYRPDTKWFTEYRAYDGEGTDMDNYTFRVQVESWGGGYTGPWFDATAEMLLEHVSVTAPAAAQVSTTPTATFSMTEGMTHLLAFEFSFAAGGFHDTEIFAPDNTRYGYQAFEANGMAFSDGPDTLLIPAQAGEWRVTTLGVGAFAVGGGVLAWGATVTEGTL